MKTIFLSMALALALVAVPAGAEGCVPTTSSPEQDTGRLAGTGMGTPNSARFYLDEDRCQVCFLSVWVYQETNGIDGLQRGDEMHDDTCGGTIESDTVIF